VAAVTLALLFAMPALAQSNEEAGLAARQTRLKTKPMHDHLLDLPGTLIESPIGLLGLTIKYSMIVADKTRVTRRIEALFREPISPVVSYGSRPGFAGGLRVKLRGIGAETSDLTFHGTFSTNSHQDYYVRYRAYELADRVYVHGRAGYNVNTNEDFYGVGTEGAGFRSVFEHTLASGRLTAGTDWTDSVRTELRVDVADHAFAEGDGSYPSTMDVLSEYGGGAPGIGGVTLAGGGVAVAFDSRDNDFYPSRGGLAELSAMRFVELGSDQPEGKEFSFTRYGLALSHFLTVGRPGRIFAARLSAEMNTDAGERQTPFFAMADLGGAEDLRSYDTGRFRDRDAIVLNLEYRYPVWDAIVNMKGGMDAVVFADLGRVYPDLFKDTASDLRTIYGFGLRARTTDGFLGRAEMAFGEEETRFILQFDPIF